MRHPELTIMVGTNGPPAFLPTGSDGLPNLRDDAGTLVGFHDDRVVLAGTPTDLRNWLDQLLALLPLATPDRPLDDRVAAAVTDGSDAFWATVVAHFPEIQSGDLDPGAVSVMEHMLAQVVRLWHTYNADD